MNIRKTFIFTEGMIEKINQLKNKLDYKHEVDVATHAINELHKAEIKELKPYAIAKLNTMERQNMTPEEKAQDKLETQEALIKAKEVKEAKAIADRVENGKRICTYLGGKVKKDDKGYDKCFWRSINYLNPKNATIHENEEYAEYMNEDHISKQFYNDITDEVIPKEVCIEGLKNCGTSW